MKRCIALLLALALLFCLTACGEDVAPDKDKNTDKVSDTKASSSDNDGIYQKVEEITVDKFIGKNYYAEIEGVAEYQDKYTFNLVWEDANNPEIKKGEVFKQEPAAGKTVKKGGTVMLYINSPVSKYIQLDARVTAEGMHKNDMRKLLVDAGFGVKEIVNSSATVPADHVISINIIPGQAYAYGTEVTMTVSSGPSKLPPIEFPTMVIGENETTAEAILRSHGFKGQVTFAYVNYIDEQFATKGTVMGIAENGVLKDALPSQIDAEGMLTLAVSNGLQNVTVELDWPQNLNGENIKELWDVRVIVGNKLDSDFGSKYVAYQPLSTDKIVFDLLKHPEMKPADNAYNFEVQIKKHDAPNTDYATYVTLLIYPVDGTWTIVGDYQPLPGISAEDAV